MADGSVAGFTHDRFAPVRETFAASDDQAAGFAFGDTCSAGGAEEVGALQEIARELCEGAADVGEARLDVDRAGGAERGRRGHDAAAFQKYIREYQGDNDTISQGSFS